MKYIVSQYSLSFTRILLLSCTFIAFQYSSIAYSTVLEWDENGDAKLGNGINANDASVSPGAELVKRLKPASETLVPELTPNNLSARQVRVRALVQDIALKHSGKPGVRKAGLTALQFVDLFDALIHRESAFNPKAVSPKGAKGLGQLMPAMMSDHRVTDPFNPAENLTASATYITSLLGEFKSPELALAAYNAGPTRVRSLGRIPKITETQEYIKWIFAKAQLGKPNLSSNTKPMAKSVAVTPVSSSNNFRPVSNQAVSETPLTGEKSVWEF